MEIRFEISDEAFNEGYKDVIKDLAMGDKIEIMKKGLMEYVKSDKFTCALTDVFFKKAPYPYEQSKELSTNGIALIRDIKNENSELSEYITETVVDILTKDGEKIVRNALTEIILRGFASNIAIQDAMKDAIRRTLNE